MLNLNLNEGVNGICEQESQTRLRTQQLRDVATLTLPGRPVARVSCLAFVTELCFKLCSANSFSLHEGRDEIRSFPTQICENLSESINHFLERKRSTQYLTFSAAECSQTRVKWDLESPIFG